MESRLKCSICDKSFAQKYHLNEHQRKIHKYDPIPTKSFTCSFCNKKYTSNKSLLAHTQKFHNTNGNIIKRVHQSRIFCPYEDCQEVLLTLVRLRMHLTANHGLESELEEIKFNDETEFQQWKSEMEQKTLTMYVRDRESWTLNDESIKNIYYCHRSNSYIKKGKDIRHIKSTGSNKIGKVCPSLIETLQDNKTISVKYWKTHCGHGVEELGRIKLDTESRIQIAAKLKEGVSFDHILDSIRDTASTDSIQRTLLLDRQDLKNITRDFNIDYTKKQCLNKLP